MEDGEEADLGPEVFGIGGDGAQCLGRRPKEQPIDRAPVLQREVRDGGGDGEDDVEVLVKDARVELS